MEFIYGTHNLEKLNQLKRISKNKGLDLSIISTEDINFNQDIVEDGTTFEENSMIKARAIEKFCKENGIIDKIIVTDDSGLCVDKLDGRPGIYTARFAGENATQKENVIKLMGELENYPDAKDRSCKLVCVLTCIMPDGKILISRGESFGTISNNIGPWGGLTFGPVYIPEGFNKCMNDLTPEEEARTTLHRQKAIEGLIEKIKKI